LNREIYVCWKEKNPAELPEIQGLNHYSIIESIPYRDAVLHKSMSGMMKI